ncbi:hypothetical protein [Streptomyces cucumeris]|uniref:hypothetical protein n=1 Tax=Streptomyces cucumeris TaxID=2962890 RepID=UPI003D7057B7
MHASSVMFVSDGVFGIADDVEEPFGTACWSAGLAAPMAYGAWVRTGIHTGFVKIGAETADTAPPEQTAPWEEVVEISVRSVEGELRVASAHDAVLTELPVLNPRGPGWYRVRVHARGRASNPGGTNTVPTERYLVTAWPQEPAPPAVLRSSPLIVETQLAHADDPPWERR